MGLTSSLEAFKTEAKEKSLNEETNTCLIHKKSAFLLKLDHRSLFLKYLLTEASSVALSPPILSRVLTESLDTEGSKDLREPVNDFIRFIGELNGKTPAFVDFMSIIFAILLLSKISLEEKCSTLYEWMCLQNESEISFDECYLSLVSIEKGFSYVVGIPESSNDTIKSITNLLFGCILKYEPTKKSLTKEQFLNLCSNRMYPIRRQIELMGSAVVDDSLDIDEFSATDEHNLSGRRAGDQWLCSPPWKPVAEMMTPPKCPRKSSKPNASLALDWVHGFRWYDCRNNVKYVSNSQFVFNSAALTVVQSIPIGHADVGPGSSATQKYFNAHSAEVISIAVFFDFSSKTAEKVSERGSLVATGDRGDDPVIHIWFSNELNSLACMYGYHKHGVSQLAFSRNGKLIYSVGVEYSVAVYDTDLTSSSLGRLIASTTGPRDKIFHCESRGDFDFASCGERHVIFWSLVDGSLSSENINGTSKTSKFTCMTAFDDIVIVGNSDGELVRLKAREEPCQPPVAAHEKAVCALASTAVGSSHLIVSGDGSGEIIIWDANITTRLCDLSLRPVGILPSGIRSLSVSPDLTKLLVTTRACTIEQFQVKAESGQYSIVSSEDSPMLLVSGHRGGEVRGLAARPVLSADIMNGSSGAQYCTVGDDQCLRIWSMSPHRQLACLDTGAVARACAYHPNGDVIAVGFGRSTSDGESGAEGMFRVYRIHQRPAARTATDSPLHLHDGIASIEQIYECHDAKKGISDIKFSADGSLIAVASLDDCVCVYSYANQYKRRLKFNKHSSPVTHFDFSSDGKFIQSNCESAELLVFDTKTGQIITESNQLRNSVWYTITCPLSWSTQGMWTRSDGGSHIECVDRSPCSKYIAAGDDDGMVRLFRCPCVVEGASSQEYTGHGSRVTNVRWMQNSDTIDKHSDYVISIGGGNMSIFVWRLHEEESDLSDDPNGCQPVDAQPREVAVEEATHSFSLHENVHAYGGGDEFMAIKPWLGVIKAPSAWSQPPRPDSLMRFNTSLKIFRKAYNDVDILSEQRLGEASALAVTALAAHAESGVSDSSCPDVDDLELQWVHGYRGHDSRNNLFHTICNGRRCLVYPAASLGIVYDVTARIQRFFKGHTRQVLSMAVLPSSSTPLAATGQRGAGPVFVWDCTTLEAKASVTTGAKAIYHLAFSCTDGKVLVAIGDDNQIFVSDWRHQRLVAKVQGAKGDIYHLIGSRAVGSSFLTCGDKVINTWTVSGGSVASKRVAVSGTISGTKETLVMQKFLSCADCDLFFAVGCSDGAIYCIQASAVVAKYSMFDSSGSKGADKREIIARGVSAMNRSFDYSVLVSGSQNGVVVIWGIDSASSKKPKLDRLKIFTLGESSTVWSTGLNSVLPPGKISSHQIQSLHISKDPITATTEISWHLAVGTRSCDILELFVSSVDGHITNDSRVVLAGDMETSVLRGHCHDELWGLAVHPFKPEFCTVGDDRTLRMWNLGSCSAAGPPLQLGAMARACAYHPNGNLIAVGFGGRIGRGNVKDQGMVRLYAVHPLVKVEEKFDSKKAVTVVRFSPTGSVLAVGGHSGTIFIYQLSLSAAGATLALRSRFSKHNSFITHLDFSRDGAYIQSNCGAYELLYSDVASGSQVESASEVKDVEWSTWTCPLGWPVQGVWPPGADGSDINAVDRSHTGHLVATADDCSRVKLFRFPCVSSQSQSLVFSGHGGHVTNVRWTTADSHLVTLGGDDKCIFQWKHVVAAPGTEDHSTTDASMKSTGNSAIHLGSMDVDNDDSHESYVHMRNTAAAVGGGDEFMAVKPWIGAIRAPSTHPPVTAEGPSAGLTLQWVHGYSSETAGSNLFYSSKGDIIYPAAALGVRLTRSEHSPMKQAYYQGHDDEVTAITISQSRRYVASGQTASKTSRGRGSVHVWDASECRLLSSMLGCHQRSVQGLAFSYDEDKLVTVGGDDNHTHVVWKVFGGSWSRVQQLATEKSDMNNVSGGAKCLHFWSIAGAKVSRKQGRYGPKYAQKALLCIANLPSDEGESAHNAVVAGTVSGDLYVFTNRECNAGKLAAHTGAIMCLREVWEGAAVTRVVSGGRDSFIRIWDRALLNLFSYTTADIEHCINSAVSSVDYRREGSDVRLLFGLVGGEIGEVPATDAMTPGLTRRSVSAISGPSSQPVCQILVRSHSVGELWGLATHPRSADVFVTAGDDRVIRIWSISQQRMLDSWRLDWSARALGWSPCGNYLAVGFLETEKFAGGGRKAVKAKQKQSGGMNGPVCQEPNACRILRVIAGLDAGKSLIFDKDFSVVKFCSSVATVSQIKFSPLGDFISVASHDQKLTTFRVDDLLGDASGVLSAKQAEFKKHSSAVLHFDYSEDQCWIQSTCEAYELLFSDPRSGHQQTSATKVADVEWSTWTCPLGWPVQGVWPPGADGSDINAVDRSHTGQLVATADDFGKVKLFRYPCVIANSKFREYSGHSSHVTNVRWASNDSHMISVGGYDKAVFIWARVDS